MITPLEIYAWMLIGMRAAGLVLMAPPFSTRVIPPLIKVTLIASIASVVTFLVDPPAATPVSIVAAVLEMARELGIGFAMGMAIRIIFATLDFAAHLITVEVGLMPGPEFDPSSGVSGNPLGSSLFYFGVILFLSGAHYTALYAFVRSFQIQGFGVYNYDILMKFKNAIPVLANFDCGTDIPANLRREISVYLVSGNGRMVVNYPPSDWHKFRIDPDMESSIVAVLPGNKLATLSGEDIKKQMNAIREAKGKEYVFQLKAQGQPVKSVQEVQERILAL